MNTVWCEDKLLLPTDIDFHSHILPGIDDGAEDIRKSLLLVESAQNAGIKKIYATPHFYAHRLDVDTFLERREKAYKKVLAQNPAIEIELGAEILVFPGIENMEGIEKLCFYNGKTVLLELPLSESLITDEHFLTVEALAQKYDIIMAHANRYSDYTVYQMIEAGAKLQLNVHDICLHREHIRTSVWAKNGYLFALGSDAHRDVSVYKKFRRAQKILSKLR